MAQRTRTNFKSTKDAVITTNGVGGITGAIHNGILEDVADSVVFNNDTVSESTENLIITTNSIGSNMRVIDIVYFTADDGSIIAQLVEMVDLSNSEIAHIDLSVSFIESDGDAGGSFRKSSTWHKNSSGTVAQIGSDTTIHGVEDLSSTPTLVFSNSSSNIRATVGSGSGGVGISFTLFAKVIVTTVS